MSAEGVQFEKEPNRGRTMLVFLILMVAPLVASDGISQCAAPQSNSMKLYMTTRKNETGYTLAQVRL
ncbi:unnamed protein product, partial [Timema podura]|nr:unnamed protein product [Timema podura]